MAATHRQLFLSNLCEDLPSCHLLLVFLPHPFQQHQKIWPIKTGRYSTELKKPDTQQIYFNITRFHTVFEIGLKSLFLPRVHIELCPVAYLAALLSGFIVCRVHTLLFASLYEGPS